MERCDFIKTAATTSACSLSATLPAKDNVVADANSEYQCRITVLRKLFHQDLYDQYPYEEAKSCGRFEEGQVFITKSVWDPPEGFCAWAWADLRPIIHSICAGNSRTMVSCCTDGLRPVIFKFECIETQR